LSLRPSDFDLDAPSWAGTLTGDLSVTIDRGRLQRFEKSISDATVRKIGTDRNMVDRISEGKERLRSGAAKEGSHEDDGVNWAYWTFICWRDAFRVVPLLARTGPVHDLVVKNKDLQVIQFGGGPAEDLVGLIEFCESAGLRDKRFQYLSIDNVDWNEHLALVREHLKTTYPAQIVSIEQLPVDINDVSVNALSPRINHEMTTLVLAANFLVTEDRISSDPKLPGSVARVVRLIAGLVPQLALIFIEPNMQASRLAAVLDRLALPQVMTELTVSYMPSQMDCWTQLRMRPKLRKQKATCICTLLPPNPTKEGQGAVAP
jgi:hypothetical protein